MATPIINVTIYQSRNPLRRFTRRAQRWRWRAVNAGNNRVLASGESYTNRADIGKVIAQLFGINSDVWLQEAGQPSECLRISRGE